MMDRKEIIAAQERLRRKHFPPDETHAVKPKHQRHQPRRDRKPAEFVKNLNASQRGLLTKFTRTGEVDARNKVTEERPMRRAAWEKRRAEKKQQQQEAA